MELFHEEIFTGRAALLSAQPMRAKQVESRWYKSCDVEFTKPSLMQWECIIVPLHIYLFLLQIGITDVIILLFFGISKDTFFKQEFL